MASRGPVDHDVVIVGAGFSGVYQLHRLRALGLSVVALDAATELGGIWHWNCYPGARVDTHVPMYEYSDEALWRDWYWDERYPDWQQLRRYFAHVDDVWDIGRDVRFGTRVHGGDWDEERRRWHLETSTGPLTARFVLLCTGFASKPYLPDLPGLADFGGACHHTARWPQGGLDLAGKRVGVIGTGASGVQVVQEAAKVSRRVVVFQRTPILAIPMVQQRLSRAQQDEEKAGYADRFRLRTETNAGFDLVPAGESMQTVSAAERETTFERLWAAGGFNFWVGNYSDVFTDLSSNHLAYEFWRDRTRERVADRALAERLAPTEPPHPFGMKRPSLEQDYYDVFDQDNVDLVDVRAEPILEVDAHGIRTESGHVDLDVLVLATGFDAVTGGITDIALRGVDGGTLADRWAGGVRSHLGIASAGFPNLLYLYGPQSPSGFCNGPTCAEVQGDWVVDLVAHLHEHGIDRIEATPRVEDEWRAVVDTVAKATLFPLADSWYMGANIPGKPRELLNFPSLQSYRDSADAVAADGYRGFVLGEPTVSSR